MEEQGVMLGDGQLEADEIFSIIAKIAKMIT
jgi:hypothetical protein